MAKKIIHVRSIVTQIYDFTVLYFFELNHIPAIFHVLFTSTIRGGFMFLVVSMHVDWRPLFVLWWGWGGTLYLPNMFNGNGI